MSQCACVSSCYLQTDPTLYTRNRSKIILQSRYTPTCFIAAHNHHQGRQFHVTTTTTSLLFSGTLSCHAHTDWIDGPFSTELVLSHFPLGIVFLMVAAETCRNVNQFLLFISTKCTPYTKYKYLSSITSYMFRCLLHYLQTDDCVTCSTTVCSLQCCH
jgi:hypothetical protein